MQLHYPKPPIATKPLKRIPANQRDCIIGKNRKARKAWARTLFNNEFTYHPITADPIYFKRLKREARHSDNNWRWY